MFQLKPLAPADVAALLDRALADPERGYGKVPTALDPDARQFLSEICDGDGRHALTALEVAVRSTPASADGVIHLTLDVIQECVQRRQVQYDKKEDGHYDTISAFIKSVRGSDPDAAIYWLAKMLVAGEDPRFIARRLVILASEDIGNADPRGLTIAVAALQTVEFIGMPEARITLAQATTYLATAPKSNRSYEAIGKAIHDVRTTATNTRTPTRAPGWSSPTSASRRPTTSPPTRATRPRSPSAWKPYAPTADARRDAPVGTHWSGSVNTCQSRPVRKPAASHTRSCCGEYVHTSIRRSAGRNR